MDMLAILQELEEEEHLSCNCRSEFNSNFVESYTDEYVREFRENGGHNSCCAIAKLKKAIMGNNNILQDLNVILNAHQDIDDALQGKPGMGVKEMQELFVKIKAANDRIGVAVMNHLPG